MLLCDSGDHKLTNTTDLACSRSVINHACAMFPQLFRNAHGPTWLNGAVALVNPIALGKTGRHISFYYFFPFHFVCKYNLWWP
jgi:hypothetical protein